jgi:hypothetical protein
MEKLDHGQCCKRIVKRMDVQEETGETRRQYWNKEPRLKKTAMSEEGEDNQQWHQRMEQETGATSMKQDSTLQDLQEDHRAGGCKVDSQDFH